MTDGIIECYLSMAFRTLQLRDINQGALNGFISHFTGRALPVLTLIDTPPATGITLHRCCTLHTCDQSNNLICLSAACKNNQGQLVGDK